MSILGPITPAAYKEPAPGRPATFFGTAYHKVTGRNQVAIPRHMAKVLEEAREGQLLLVWWNKEGCLRLYTQKQLDTIIHKIQGREDLSAQEKALLIRTLAGEAEPIETDSQNRFVLPGRWVEALSLKDEVAFFGAHGHIEIWPAQVRKDLDSQERERSAAAAQKIADLML